MSDATVKLTIDGQEVTVPRGTTLREAAKQLDIEIPTLCHVEGLEPSASCFLCAVEIEGRRNFAPSCAMPAEAGMVVKTTSDDVRAARRMALELLLSDHAGECVAPCAARCPAGLDIPGFVQPIAVGETLEAMPVLYQTLSLPGTLGRVCPRLCEDHCRRSDHDEGLAIGALHRWATDRNMEAAKPWTPPVEPPSGKSVAIIGAGPAGLTAAFYLLQRGHKATLFDAHAEAGGMLRYGIPAYRLPRYALDDEIEVIQRMGATFRMETRWGRDFTLDELRDRHDAVFVAIGAQQSRGLGCDGDEMVMHGIDFLERVARGETPHVGERVVVVGGGNTAMDAARTAVRLGASVRVVYRRTRNEMPCLLEEVEGAEKEGVDLLYLLAPTRLIQRPGGLELACQRMELGEPDASGRRRPRPIEGSETGFMADTVIAAVGQSVERELAREAGLEVSGWGIAAHPRTLETSLRGVFAGGDAVLGADLAVRAVAAGRMAAASIDQYLRGEKVKGIPEIANVTFQPMDDLERAAVFRSIEKAPKTTAEELTLAERRQSFDEIDPGLVAAQAAREAKRCMSCGCRVASGCALRRLATEYEADTTRYLGSRRRFDQDLSHPEIIYEPGKCILCDACVKVAAEARETTGVALVGRGFDVSMAVPFDEPLSEGLREAAKRAAEVCPTGALALRTARACDHGRCVLPGGGEAEPLVRIRPMS